MHLYLYKLSNKKKIRNDIPIMCSLSKSFKNFFVHNIFSCVCDISIFSVDYVHYSLLSCS